MTAVLAVGMTNDAEPQQTIVSKTGQCIAAGMGVCSTARD